MSACADKSTGETDAYSTTVAERKISVTGSSPGSNSNEAKGSDDVKVDLPFNDDTMEGNAATIPQGDAPNIVDVLPAGGSTSAIPVVSSDGHDMERLSDKPVSTDEDDLGETTEL